MGTVINLNGRIDAEIKSAGIPIVGIAIGNEENRSTWLVQPASLQAQAQPIIDAYADPTPEQLQDEDAEREIGNKKVMAVALALWECIPAPTMTKSQLRSRAKAIYKGLV